MHFVCEDNKITTLFNNSFSSVSVFEAYSQEYHDTLKNQLLLYFYLSKIEKEYLILLLDKYFIRISVFLFKYLICILCQPLSLNYLDKKRRVIKYTKHEKSVSCLQNEVWRINTARTFMWLSKWNFMKIPVWCSNDIPCLTVSGKKDKARIKLLSFSLDTKTSVCEQMRIWIARQ